MRKIYLGIIFIIVLTLIGCSKNVIQQNNGQSGNTPDSQTIDKNVGTPNVVKNYSDENHKVIEIGKLTLDLDTYHIVSEIYDGNSYIIKYKEDKPSSGKSSTVKSSTGDTITIKEMKDLNLMDIESIKSYLINWMPSYENLKVYKNITDASAISYLSVISAAGKSCCIVNYGDTSYCIESSFRAIEYYFFDKIQSVAYEEIKQNIECAESFSADIYETLNYETDIANYDIVQGKNSKKYTAQLRRFSGDDKPNFNLSSDKDKNMLSIIVKGDINEAITFIDVNLDGYADIQAIDQPGAMNNSYKLYVWDESVNNFVQVKCDTDISYFEVNEGCIVTWERGGADSGNQTVLNWKDNKTLVKVSEEEYHTYDELSDNLCTDNEEVLFSFKIANSAKTLSVCQSKTKPDYIVYRFGTKDKIELEFPENKADSWGEFTYSNYLRGGGAENEGIDLNYLSFENDGYKYKIYQEFTHEGKKTSVGIMIVDKTTNKETNIKGLSNSMEGSLINLRDNKNIK